MNSLKAQLLIAVPQLPDSNFFRTVVLMIQHDEEGALGVVLNRPTEVTIADIWEDIADEECDSDEPISVGGPVEGPLIAVHTDESRSENEIIPGVYVATERDNLNELVQQNKHPVRLFTGYSGWGVGQLEGELEAGGWLTAPAKAEYIFYDGDDLWKEVTHGIGRNILEHGLQIASIPDDPSMN